MMVESDKWQNGTNFVNACIHSIPGSEWKFLITCPGEKSFIIVGRLSGPKLGEKDQKVGKLNIFKNSKCREQTWVWVQKQRKIKE